MTPKSARQARPQKPRAGEPAEPAAGAPVEAPPPAGLALGVPLPLAMGRYFWVSTFSASPREKVQVMVRSSTPYCAMISLENTW